MKDLKSQFVDWLATKPADGEYDYWDCAICPAAQFLSATRTRRDFDILEFELVEIPTAEIYGGSVGGVLQATPWTFGALRERLMQS